MPGLSGNRGQAMPNLQASYFSLMNPLTIIDRLLHGLIRKQMITIGKRRVEVSWTDRAAREMEQRRTPLTVEVQLMFSCVVKKRVLFDAGGDFATSAVNDF